MTVKNEQDVIRQSILQLLSQGVEGVIVSDNGSADGTQDIVRDLARDHSVYLAHDGQIPYYQAIKMNALANLARRAGADWIIPFDADEFWFAPGESVAEHLRRSSHQIVTAVIHNLFPLADTLLVDAAATYRLDLSVAEMGKVAFRSHRHARLTMGNHRVVRPGGEVEGLVIAHLPWRSFTQFRAKLSQGKQAMDATDLASHQSHHWRALGGSSDDELRALWAQLLTGAGDTLAWSPVGPFAQERVLDWPHWPVSDE